MSSIKGQSTYDNTRHLNYISTAPYGDNIFTYTTSVNSSFVTIGQIQSLLNLGTVTAGVGGTAPAGRILRTNGRKLFPGANPCSSIITTGGGTVSVTQIRSQMVGVIDVVSGLSGFIDPNDSLFAIYNVDKAIDYPNDGGTPGNAAHKGPSLYTAGNVSAAGGVGVGPVASVAAQVAGNVVADGSVTAGGQIRSNTTTALTTVTATATNTINPSLGQLFTQIITFTTGSQVLTIASSAAPLAGSVVYLVISTSASHTTAGTVSAGSNVKMPSLTIGTAASKVYGITFVSDGTNLVAVGITGGAVSTTGM